MEKRKKTGAINNGAGWDNGSRSMLKELVSKGLPTKKIAKVMGRTPNAITYQKCAMGLTVQKGVSVRKGLGQKADKLANLFDLIKKANGSNVTSPVKKKKVVAKSVGVVPQGFNPVTMETNKSVNPSNVTREQAKDITRSAREIARANGKRITMAMFFVEDL